MRSEDIRWTWYWNGMRIIVIKLVRISPVLSAPCKHGRRPYGKATYTIGVPAAGASGYITTIQDRLLFIFVYVRIYPIQEFQASSSWACANRRRSTGSIRCCLPCGWPWAGVRVIHPPSGHAGGTSATVSDRMSLLDAVERPIQCSPYDTSRCI